MRIPRIDPKDATGLFDKVVGTTDIRAVPNATDNVVACEAHFAPI